LLFGRFRLGFRLRVVDVLHISAPNLVYAAAANT
jgi:hypothetical protein